jgi:hypothetical protein
MTEWGAAAIGGLVTAIMGGAGVFLVRYYRAHGDHLRVASEERRKDDAEGRKARREADAADRERESIIVRELKELVEQQRRDGMEYRQQIHDLRGDMQHLANELAVCRAGRARADERIAALEDALEEAGIAHRKWSPDSATGSDLHRPLPPVRPHEGNP